MSDETTQITLEQLAAQLARIERKVDGLVAQDERQRELIDELMPIGKEALAVASAHLEGWERRGYLRFGQEVLGIGQEIMDRFTPEDVHQLRDNVVSILGVVRQVTGPRMMALATQVSAAMEQTPREGVGVLGMLKATHDEDTQRGLATTLAILRQLGRGVKQVATDRQASRDQLAQRLGATSPRAAAPASPSPTLKPVVFASGQAAASGPQIAGFALDAEGFLLDRQAWTAAFAAQMATAHGIAALTEQHWTVINYMRAQHAAQGKTPNIRAISTATGIATKELYSLFLKMPGITAARIAGVPKPVGCI
jgi:TusE/DsrC/DsvC family sulfur relay protein